MDLIKIQIEKDRLQDQLRSARELMTPLRIKLNALLNREPDAFLPPPLSPPVTPYAFTKRQLIEWLKENNPELKSLDSLQKKAKIQIKLARKGYLPSFSLGLDYIIIDEARMSGIEESGKDPLVAMVQLSLPIWFSKNKARVNRARWELKKVLNQKKDRENNLLARMELLYYQLQDEEQKIKLYSNKLLPQARQAVAVVRSAYQTGNSDILNFIDSQRTLLNFELNQEFFISAYAQRQAELEMLVGKHLF
jgi:outer membrane protein TolC